MLEYDQNPGLGALLASKYVGLGLNILSKRFARPDPICAEKIKNLDEFLLWGHPKQWVMQTMASLQATLRGHETLSPAVPLLHRDSHTLSDEQQLASANIYQTISCLLFPSCSGPICLALSWFPGVNPEDDQKRL